MLSWELEVVINVALLGFALWVRRRSRARRALWRLALIYGALFVASSLIGTAAGTLVLLDPFAGETAAPSRGTLTVLGIPEPVSWAATGVTAFLLPTIAALFMCRRSHDDTHGEPAD